MDQDSEVENGEFFFFETAVLTGSWSFSPLTQSAQPHSVFLLLAEQIVLIMSCEYSDVN